MLFFHPSHHDTPQSPMAAGVAQSEFRYFAMDGAADQRQDMAPAFQALAQDMLDHPLATTGDAPEGDGVLAPLYTYLGYLIEHDICAPCDYALAEDNRPVLSLSGKSVYPLQREDVLQGLANRHTGGLRLESLYGDALPANARSALRDTENPARMRLDGPAACADPRNASHPILTRLSQALLRLHNLLALQLQPRITDPQIRFSTARTQTTWLWQWLVLNDYLPHVAETVHVDHALSGGAAAYSAFYARQPLASGALPVPLEYAFAASGFSHSMIRAAYDLNIGQGRPTVTCARHATRLETLLRGTAPVSILMNRLASTPPAKPDHVARRITPRLARALGDLQDPSRTLPRNLALRMLLTGYRLSLPTAEATVTALNQVLQHNGQPALPLLPPDSLATGPSATALSAGGFAGRTPLWVYILKEAELLAQGLHLGPLGSTLLSQTLVGLVIHDASSYWHAPDGWHPARLPVGGHTIQSFHDLLTITGLIPRRSGLGRLSVNGSARSITGA